MSRNPKRKRKGTVPLSERVQNPRLGKCYELSAQTLLDRLLAGEGWVLVHGRPRLTCEPFVKYGHAWLEKDHGTSNAIVFDPVADLAALASDYYRVGEIDPEDNLFTYTREQTLDIMETSNHWGPWEGIEAPPLMMPTKENAIKG